MGRTNVVLDEKLVAECQKATGIKTRRALIHHALRELLRHERQKEVLEWFSILDGEWPAIRKNMESWLYEDGDSRPSLRQLNAELPASGSHVIIR